VSIPAPIVEQSLVSNEPATDPNVEYYRTMPDTLPASQISLWIKEKNKRFNESIVFQLQSFKQLLNIYVSLQPVDVPEFVKRMPLTRCQQHMLTMAETKPGAARSIGLVVDNTFRIEEYCVFCQSKCWRCPEHDPKYYCYECKKAGASCQRNVFMTWIPLLKKSYNIDVSSVAKTDPKADAKTDDPKTDVEPKTDAKVKTVTSIEQQQLPPPPYV
jgi:hypothetical protein